MHPSSTLALAATLALVACSSQQAYSIGQTWQRNECYKIGDAAERKRCLDSHSTSFDEYKRQADAARKTD
jgi:hypothetical protein